MKPDKPIPKDVPKAEAPANEAAPPTDAGEEVKSVPIFQDAIQRVLLPAGIGPGFQQSCFAKRRLNRLGKAFLGELMFYDHADSIGRIMNPWFSNCNNSPPTEMSWHNAMLKDISKDYADLGDPDKTVDTEDPGYVSSIHSFNTKIICKHWAQAEHVTNHIVQLCEAAFLMNEFVYPAAVLGTMNMWKYGTTNIKNLCLATLPYPGEDIPSIAVFGRTINTYFDTHPFAWHWLPAKEFVQNRFRALALTGHEDDGLIVPIVEGIASLVWRQITGSPGDGNVYCTPFESLKKVPGAYEYYIDTYLAWRTGLDPRVDHKREYVMPGAFYKTYADWTGPGFPTTISPALFMNRMNEFRFNTTVTISQDQPYRYSLVAGTGYPEKVTAPTFSARGGYSMNFSTVRPAVPGTVAGCSSIAGNRGFVTKPELFVTPGGPFNRAICDWFAHRISNYQAGQIGLQMGIPMLASDWTDQNTPVDVNGVWAYYDQCTFEESGTPTLDVMEDFVRMITNNPDILGDLLRGRVLRHPDFLDTFPGSYLIADPAADAVNPPYIPHRQRDLVASLISWMELERFTENERKTGKWLTAETNS